MAKKNQRPEAPVQRVTAKPRRFVAVTPEGLLPSSKGSPCPKKRKGCPVQLVWQEGRPFLRLCDRPKKPGRMIPVPDDPSTALALSRRLCACWEASGKPSRRSFRRCGVETAPLGRYRRAR